MVGKSVDWLLLSGYGRPCQEHRDYQTLARSRTARPAPRKRLKVAELAPASELWRFALQARIAVVLLPASFKHWIPSWEEAHASVVQFTALSPAFSNAAWTVFHVSWLPRVPATECAALEIEFPMSVNHCWPFTWLAREMIATEMRIDRMAAIFFHFNSLWATVQQQEEEEGWTGSTESFNFQLLSSW